jgi:hypothetical protein
VSTRLKALTRKQLRDPSLLKQGVCYVNGEWTSAKSGKTFAVTGMTSNGGFPGLSLFAASVLVS